MPQQYKPRRVPKQSRSRDIVDAIVQAGELILEEEGEESLTTSRIAERAGVSVGSLYRYFPNKEAVLTAIYGSEVAKDATTLSRRPWVIQNLPIAEAIGRLVDFQVERHQKLFERDRGFYRDHHRDFSLHSEIGRDAVAKRMSEMLHRHSDELRDVDLDQAAFLLSRGVSALLRFTLDEDPERLDQVEFRDAIVDMLVRYLTNER